MGGPVRNQAGLDTGIRVHSLCHLISFPLGTRRYISLQALCCPEPEVIIVFEVTGDDCLHLWICGSRRLDGQN